MKKNAILSLMLFSILLAGTLFLNTTFTPLSEINISESQPQSDLGLVDQADKEISAYQDRPPKRINSRNLNKSGWIKRF